MELFNLIRSRIFNIIAQKKREFEEREKRIEKNLTSILNLIKKLYYLISDFDFKGVHWKEEEEEKEEKKKNSKKGEKLKIGKEIIEKITKRKF